MISFRESLETKKTLQIASECFAEMVRHKVDPDLFADWLGLHAEEFSDSLTAESQAWLETELRLNEAGLISDLASKAKGFLGGLFKGGSGDPLASAMSKIQDLIGRSKRQGSRLSQENLQSMLHNVMAVLKSRQFPTPATAQPAAQPAEPQPAAAQPPADARAGVPRANVDLSPQVSVAGAGGSYKPTAATPKPTTPAPKPKPQTFVNVEGVSTLQRKLLETRLKSLCFLLSDSGYDPMAFAEWYTSQRVLDEGWLTGALAGIKGGLAGGWDRFMGGGEGSVLDAFRKGYITSRDASYEQDDIRAIESAMKSLIEFSKGLPPEQFADVQKQIAELITALREALTARIKPKTEDKPKETGEESGKEKTGEESPAVVDYSKDENVVAFLKASDKLGAEMGLKLPPMYKKIMAQWNLIDKNAALRQKIVEFTKQELLKKPDDKSRNFYAINTVVYMPKGSKEVRLKSAA